MITTKQTIVDTNELKIIAKYNQDNNKRYNKYIFDISQNGIKKTIYIWPRVNQDHVLKQVNKQTKTMVNQDKIVRALWMFISEN